MKDKTIHAQPRPNEGIHVPFLAASLLFGVFGGFTLAVSLPIEGLLGSVDASWVAHAQVHGHLQVVGFAGLFIVGMAFRLAPRFGGRRAMSLPGSERWVWWLLVGGLVGRAVGQPLADERPFAILTVAGAAAEVSGAVLFALMVGLTLAEALRQRHAHAVLMAAGATGLVAQAFLGFWWLARMAADGRTLLPSSQDAVLLHLQFFGFILPVVLGVGMRSFPTFFARTPPTRVVGGSIATLSIGGVALWTAGGLLATGGSGNGWEWAVAGQAMTGIGVLVAIATFGPWRRATRLAAASKGLAWSIQPAVLWLALSGALLTATAVRAAVAGGPVSATTLDAVRHIFALGVVTLAIVGMAQLILPEFASERLVRAPGGWRGPFFGLALSTAGGTRGLLLLAGVQGEARWWVMATSGVLAWIVLATFTRLAWRASRSHRTYTRRIARWRDQELPLAGET